LRCPTEEMIGAPITLRLVHYVFLCGISVTKQTYWPLHLFSVRMLEDVVDGYDLQWCWDLIMPTPMTYALPHVFNFILSPH